MYEGTTIDPRLLSLNIGAPPSIASVPPVVTGVPPVVTGVPPVITGVPQPSLHQSFSSLQPLFNNFSLNPSLAMTSNEAFQPGFQIIIPQPTRALPAQWNLEADVMEIIGRLPPGNLWSTIASNARRQYSLGHGRFQWWGGDPTRRAEEEIYSALSALRETYGEHLQPPFDVVDPHTGVILNTGLLEKAHPSFNVFVMDKDSSSNERRKYVTQVLNHIVPKINEGVYGPIGDNFLNSPTVLPGGLSIFLSGELISDIMTGILLGCGNASILSHWQGLAPTHPRILIYTVQLAVALAYWAVDYASGKRSKFTQGNYGRFYNQAGVLIRNWIADPVLFPVYIFLEKFWLRNFGTFIHKSTPHLQM